MYKYLFSLITIALGLSCSSESSSNKNAFSFGGQITNPKSDFVILAKGELNLDTIFLNQENKFFKKFSNLNEGLYTFIHGNELQYFFANKKDSIHVNLNTLDFDESLVFSGIGSEKNEYLINLFLENEQDNKTFRSYFNYSPQEFHDKVYLFKELKEMRFQEFEVENPNLSKEFKKLVLETINYGLFKKMEYYPLAHKKVKNLDEYPVLNSDFYDYRKEIKINNEDLVGYYAYTEYIINFLYNQSYCKKNANKKSIRHCFFKSIDENIEIESFKNKLLMGNIIHQLFKEGANIDSELLSLFLEISSNEYDKENVRFLIADKETLQENKNIDNFELTDLNGNTKKLSSLISNKKSVIYFWSKKHTSTQKINAKVYHLSRNHPSINFIGINTDTNIESPTLKRDENNYYQITSPKVLSTYNSSGYPRTIIVSENGIVKNSYTNIFSKNFSKRLKDSEKNNTLLD